MTNSIIKKLEQMGKYPTVRLQSDRQVWADAAEMLRSQHEAIKQLREALADTAQNLVWMQWGDCRKFLTQGPMITVHEAVAIAEKALKDTEGFQ